MRIAVVGTGLIGTSIGLDLRRLGHEVVGHDVDAERAATARARGALDAVAPTLEGLWNPAPDLVVVAAPPRATIELLGRIPPAFLAMDVAGVKVPILAAAGERRFVGTHPMAGRERSGPEAASASLFRGATWVVVPGSAAPADLTLVVDLVRRLGANPVEMTAADHDAAVARISHLPQILAAALVDLAAADPGAFALAAGSLRDLTRVAMSEPGIWVELLGANEEAVATAIDEFVERLLAYRARLGNGDRLGEDLARARRLREGLAAPVTPVRVALADRPGELAKVGRALAATAVDVRDLQLRHAPYGGGGVLTIAVRPGEAAPLVDALAAEGLEVIGGR